MPSFNAITFISGTGSALAVVALLVAIAKRPRALRNASHPVYMRRSYDLSHIVTLAVIVCWGLAAWQSTIPSHLLFAIDWIATPLPVAFIFMRSVSNWSKLHGEEIPEAVKLLTQQMEELRAQRMAGLISETELMRKMMALRREASRSLREPKRKIL